VRYDDRPGTLYRLYDGDGSLLYVGATLNVWARIVAHKCDKPWFTEIARAEFKHFATRREAMKAEAVAVENENPRFNKTAGGIDGSFRLVCPHCNVVIAQKMDGDRSWFYTDHDAKAAA
jgi:predicted GIY-YIG superfamily endonuclease